MQDPQFKIEERNGKKFIYDSNRKKFVQFTPEEWVRQHFVYYLIHTKKYPASLISIEKQIQVGTRKKRYDIVVYKHEIPWMVIECKSESEPITTHVVQQILSYQTVLQVNYLVISNGKHLHCYNTATQQWTHQVPFYD